MDSRIVEPHTMRLALSRGDWLVVKAQLNAGETMDLFEEAAPGIDITAPDVLKTLSPTKLGTALILAYLVDWSLVDGAGHPLDLRHAQPFEKREMLRSVTFDSLIEIMNAVTDHDARIRQEKKLPAAESASPDPLPSLVGVGGGTNG